MRSTSGRSEHATHRNLLLCVLHRFVTSSLWYCGDRGPLGQLHGRRFRHRIQLVERDRPGQHLGRHAVVQHRARWRRARWWPSLRFGWLMRAGCTSRAFAGAISACIPGWFRWGWRSWRSLFASSFDRLLDGHALFRLARPRGARRRLEGPGFFARVCRFIFSICRFTRKCSGLCLSWRFFARWFFGPRPADGNWWNVFATDG